MEVESLGEGRDFKLWPGGGRPWDWRETGTEHHPGIQPADVAELLENGAEIVVLSRGRELRLQTASSALEELASTSGSTCARRRPRPPSTPTTSWRAED